MPMETKNTRYSTPVCEVIAMEPEKMIALSTLEAEWWEDEDFWEQ